MLNVPTPFPHAGCRAFVPTISGLAAPVTVLRHNADGTSLVRHDPSIGFGETAAPAGIAASWNTDRDLRGASGNSTVNTDSLFETVAEAVEKANHQPEHRKARRTRTRRKVSA